MGRYKKMQPGEPEGSADRRGSPPNRNSILTDPQYGCQARAGRPRGDRSVRRAAVRPGARSGGPRRPAARDLWSTGAKPPSGWEPDLRGSHHRDGGRQARPGSIPAWAGKPRQQQLTLELERVHPRVGGEAAEPGGEAHAVQGPSPRGRGSLGGRDAGDRRERSIPAWAGKPCRASWSRGHERVHPRVGGEAIRSGKSVSRRRGPSPRGRGSREWRGEEPRRPGSIPAWAGKPSTWFGGHRCCGVHPRVGGEAGCHTWTSLESAGPSPRGRGSRGPSPRGRGSRDHWQLASDAERSIPAWAGKPA